MEACHGIWHGPQELLDRNIQSVVVDSRLVTKDSVFVATVGERVDGHRFIPDIYGNGAPAPSAGRSCQILPDRICWWMTRCRR